MARHGKRARPGASQSLPAKRVPAEPPIVGSAHFVAGGPPLRPLTVGEQARGLGRILLSLLGALVVLALVGYLVIVNFERSRRWWRGRVCDLYVAAPATVIAQGAVERISHSRNSSHRYVEAWIRHAYRHTDREWVKTLSVRSFGSGRQQEALAWVRLKYPTGSSIEVHVDPDRPEVVVLDKDEELPALWEVLVGGFFTLILGLAGIVVLGSIFGDVWEHARWTFGGTARS